MKAFAATAFAVICSASVVEAQTVVVALSTERVEISSNFTGASVTVFGAAEGMAADVPTEVVVLLRGPAESIVVRRKERLLGLWINRAEFHFDGVPSFYALQSTSSLEGIADEALLSSEGIGLDALVARLSDDDDPTFAEATIRLRQDAGWFVETVGAVDRPGGSVFTTRFDLPADVPIGDYVVDVFLFQAGALVTRSTAPLEIAKTGAEQFIFDASRNSPWLYAIAVVLIAVTAGWLGGVIFRRD